MHKKDFHINNKSLVFYYRTCKCMCTLYFKDDFQSVLRTLKSLLNFFSCNTSQNVNILQLLTRSKFKVKIKTTAIIHPKRLKL